MSEFKRPILTSQSTNAVAEILQQRLVDMVDLALILKQAHWQVIGTNFRAVHLQLDEIIIDIRAASDEIAERISTLGVAPDGRSSVVSSSSKLGQFEYGFANSSQTISAVADTLQAAITGLRESIGKLGDLDPISEDMLIAITAPLEKHLWMIQAQEA